MLELFKKPVYDQIYAYFINNDLLGDGQFGVGSLHFTALALSKVTNTWLSNLDSGRMSSVVLLGIQKAFGTVDHQILLDKFRCYGISGDQLVFFASYLVCPKRFKTTNGLKEQLIPAFSKDCEWLKCKLSSLDSNPSMTPFKLILNNYEIRRVKKTKCLGMIVDNSLTWEDHINYITLKINRGIGIIRRVRQLIQEKALLLLYQTLIDPYFRYCSTIWGQCGETLKDKL